MILDLSFYECFWWTECQFFYFHFFTFYVECMSGLEWKWDRNMFFGKMDYEHLYFEIKFVDC